MKMHDEIRNLLWKSHKECPRILDLGCSNSGTIFCIYKYYFLEKNKYFDYTGVDLIDHTWRPNSQACDLDFEIDFEITTAEFTKNFHPHFKTDIRDFVNDLSPTEEFDFIIVSNILHFLNSDDAELIFEKCLNHLIDPGYIYICVLNSSQIDSYPDRNLYDLERFNKLKNKTKMVWENLQNGIHYEMIAKGN